MCIATICIQGSWEKKIIDRVQNTRKRTAGEPSDGPPSKRGRPKIDKILDRYPPYAPNMETGDTDHEQEMKDELAGGGRKDVIIPHLRASFAARRDFILSAEESNGYDDIIDYYPALKEAYAVSCLYASKNATNYI